MDTKTINLKEKKKISLVVKLIGGIIFFSFLFVIFFAIKSPFFQQVKINDSDEVQIFYMGERVESTAYINDELMYIPFSFIKKYIDSEIIWDESNDYVIITTSDNVFHIQIDESEGLLNLQPFSFTYPIKEKDNEIFLPVDPVCNYYNIDINYYKNDKLLVIHDLEKPLLKGVLLEKTKLRKDPELNSYWYEEINFNKEVIILDEDNGWYWIESNDGLMGYVKKDSVEISNIVISEYDEEIYNPWNPLGEEIVMTWEYSNKYSSIDINEINKLTSVQVVSPTWFHLEEDGIVENIADIEYVDWAHENNYKVWALFSNNYDLDLTHNMLSNPDLRIKVMKQLLTYVDLYNLDGINIDFENVYLSDKELLVQFVRELTPLLHEKDQTISIDVTFKSLSENWSLFLDREKLSEIVDYIVVMGYDEHWASSPVSGSVSSLPWVESEIQEILQEVPSDKVILGVPLYTRLWIEETDSEGNIEVSSKALSMDTVNQWIVDHNARIDYDDNSGQNYVEVESGNITYKIWLEDSTSMEKRVEIMDKYNLAGIATWRRGFESKDFWQVISGFMN